MTVTVLILLGVMFLAGVLAGMFALLVAGIRSDDRRRDIYLAPRNRAESASRAATRETLPLRRAPRQNGETMRQMPGAHRLLANEAQP